MSTPAEQIVDEPAEPISERDYFTLQLLSLLDNKDSAFEFDLAPSRLALLSHIFGLSDFEKKLIAVLWVCVYAPEIRNRLTLADPALPQLCPLLISRLMQAQAVYRLGSESPLILWEMVREQEYADNSISLTIDPQIVAWLEDNNELDQWLVGRAEVFQPSFRLKKWRLGQLGKDISKCLRQNSPCRVFFDTADTKLAQAQAAALASRLGMVVVNYDLAQLSPELQQRYAIRVQRQSFLDRCIPWFGQARQSLSQPPGIAPFPLQFIQGSAIHSERDTGGKDWVIKFDRLTNQDRKIIWQFAQPEIKQWSTGEIDDLVWRAHLSASDILSIGSKRPQDLRQATDLIRELKREDLCGLTQRVDSQFNWDDLVVPDEVDERLHEVAFEARERSWLWSNPQARRLFPHGRGLVALLSGPPGSGKTMAAQVIANELGLDLLRVDLSAVVSKWVGETTQNLQKILSANVSQQAVLFFDEADSLFGKRVDEIRDANDRYVNTDSGHLMVALENFDGIILMATNLIANIDTAFIRRVRHLITFPKPTAAAREVIWRKILGSVFPSEQINAFDAKLTNLASIEATGAQIKSAILSSVFATRRHHTDISIQVLGKMLCRELAKDGRGLSERDLVKRLGES